MARSYELIGHDENWDLGYRVGSSWTLEELADQIATMAEEHDDDKVRSLVNEMGRYEFKRFRDGVYRGLKSALVAEGEDSEDEED